MLGIFKDLKKKKEQKKLLLDFYQELKKNLESYYVMDQLARFRFYRMDAWLKLKNSVPGAGGEAVLIYARRLEEYNALLDDFTRYEQWYAADINNKTPASARILHDKREEPRQKFEGLESVIKSAIQSLERYLLETNILKIKV